MFICKECVETNYENLFLPMSVGDCEVCGLTNTCADIPSSHLVSKKPKDSESLKEMHTSIRLTNEQSEKLKQWEQQTGKNAEDLVKELLIQFLDSSGTNCIDLRDEALRWTTSYIENYEWIYQVVFEKTSILLNEEQRSRLMG